jgi:hypothetical protein
VAEVNLRRRYRGAKHNIEKRTSAESEENIRIARQYGREYFDGSRDTGYGGYRYDGRWLPITEDIRTFRAQARATASPMWAVLRAWQTEKI